MVIFMLEGKISNQKEGGDEIKVCIYSKYTEKALISPKVFAQIKYSDKEEYRQVIEEDMKNPLVANFVTHYTEIINKIDVTDETKRMLKILNEINAIEYIETDAVYLKNKPVLVIKEKVDYILNEIALHDFYVLDANKIALELFRVPSSKLVLLDNSRELLNKNISKKLNKKINFLQDIQVKRDESSNTLDIQLVNNKCLGRFFVNMNDLQNTSLKVGRIGRHNLAAIPGYVIRRKRDKIFTEDIEGAEALVFIPIEKYSKQHLIDTFNLEYYKICKNCIVGTTYFEKVESLFK